jgi:hypothetical protein
VILMKKKISDIEFVFPKQINFESFAQNQPLEPFSDKTVSFLSLFSKTLLKNPKSKEYPDLVTLGFFCRKANIMLLKKQYSDPNVLKLGIGLVFHIAPSNVAVNFAYSLVSGLLSGNSNIVRLPSLPFEQVNVICEVLSIINNDLNHNLITSRIALVRYDRSSSATKFFSSICDSRVIWGGNDTIEKIRENKIPPRSFDLTFADRYSMCVINANEYLNESFPEKIAKSFYNDTYLFDQNACTAPHLIIWLGTKKNVIKSQSIFWKKLHDILINEYKIQPIIAVDKLATFYNQSINMSNIKKIETPDNLIWRIKLNKLANNIDKYKCNSGYFSEYHANSINDIKSIIDKSYQTLSYYGFSNEELNKFIKTAKVKGIDRIVPIGRTSEFSLTWDGYNLITTLSRVCEII